MFANGKHSSLFGQIVKAGERKSLMTLAQDNSDRSRQPLGKNVAEVDRYNDGVGLKRRNCRRVASAASIFETTPIRCKNDA
jgi:hypothetical protein